MKIVTPSQPIPTHIISGFLGAGKTTLLKAWLAQKPANEVWAILMNEFGQIGIDQALITQDAGYKVEELLGGCLCCTSQLPMQIALSRLISSQKFDRLFIEPTGLGHPQQLLEQLNEPQWSSHLALQAPITVVDALRIADTDWQAHPLYREQIQAADFIVLSHTAQMRSQDQQALLVLQQEYAAYQKTWLFSEQGNIDFKIFEKAYVGESKKIQPLLAIQRTLTATQPLPEIKQLPYHYVQRGAAYQVAGWKLPKRWQFNFYDVLDLLCEQQDWLRIKAIFFTDHGWKSFNFNPDQFNYQDVAENTDNRIELIYQQPRDWQSFEDALMACRTDDIR